MHGLKNKLKTTKGFIFAGCSFTWGQGLYYYSGLDTVQSQENEHTYDHKKVSISQIAYCQKHRFASRVSNYFETFNFVRHGNGGSNDDNIKEWSYKIFDPDCPWHEKIHPTEIDVMVFQMTQPHRDINIYTGNPHFDLLKDINTLEEYINRHGHKNLEEFRSWFTQNTISNVYDFLYKIEQQGIRTILFTWPSDNVSYIRGNKWLNDRFMSFDYLDNTYNSIEEMMLRNKDLVIKTDTEFFSTPPEDHHPSMKCHDVISSCLIRYLTEKVYDNR
jgi:hypothetical protein